MQEDSAGDTLTRHRAVATSAAAVHSQRHAGISVETSTGDTAAVPITEVAGITVAGDMALPSASVCIRRMGMQRRCAVLRDSMTSLVYGASIPAAQLHIDVVGEFLFRGKESRPFPRFKPSASSNDLTCG